MLTMTLQKSFLFLSIGKILLREPDPKRFRKKNLLHYEATE